MPGQSWSTSAVSWRQRCRQGRGDTRANDVDGAAHLRHQRQPSIPHRGSSAAQHTAYTAHHSGHSRHSAPAPPPPARRPPRASSAAAPAACRAATRGTQAPRPSAVRTLRSCCCTGAAHVAQPCNSGGASTRVRRSGACAARRTSARCSGAPALPCPGPPHRPGSRGRRR